MHWSSREMGARAYINISRGEVHFSSREMHFLSGGVGINQFLGARNALLPQFLLLGWVLPGAMCFHKKCASVNGNAWLFPKCHGQILAPSPLTPGGKSDPLTFGASSTKLMRATAASG